MHFKAVDLLLLPIEWSNVGLRLLCHSCKLHLIEAQEE